MKRFYFIAAMAIMAAACQKTEIQNEVQTPIGFSTEVGKQTRAIVQDGTYLTDQTFGVYAYGYQLETVEVQGVPVTQRIENSTSTPMINIEISYDDNGTDADASDDAWRATGDVKYYWPNDPRTRLDFYAYSPYIQRLATQDAPSTATGADKNMTVSSLSHTENGGLVFEGYTHTNMYVDFMEATPIKEAKFSDPDGLQNSNSVTSGTVPMTFNHKMTQVLFKVTTDELYPGITFTVESITLNNVKNQGNYNNGTWAPSGSASYIIFPANTANGAKNTNPLNMADNDQTPNVDESKMEAEIPLTNNANAAEKASMTTTGVIMIPQDVIASTTGNDPVNGQSFTIVYRIEGTGVASETVSKTVDLFKDAQSTVHWEANKKITYTVKIGLKEILFEPSVADWTPADGNEYTFQQ